MTGVDLVLCQLKGFLFEFVVKRYAFEIHTVEAVGEAVHFL